MQTTKDEKVSLASIGNGAAIELFDDELQKVINNILDPNTKPDAPREVSLKVTIKPDKNRSFGPAFISVGNKTAPPASFTTNLFFGRENGRGIARELQTQQGDLFEQASDKVTPITPKEGSK